MTLTLLSIVLLVILSVLVMFPLSALIFGSFSSGSPILPFPLTLDNYIKIFAIRGFQEVIINTLLFSIGATALAFLIGVPLNIIILRTNIPAKKFFEISCLAPIFITPVIFALSWSFLISPTIGLFNVLLRNIGFPSLFGYSLLSMAFVEGLWLVPYVILLTSGSIASIDPELEESSRVVGATTIKTLVSVTIPLIKPSITSALLIVFITSIGSFGIPAIIGLPVRIYTLATKAWEAIIGSYPADYAIGAATASLIMLITLFLLYGYRQSIKLRERYFVVRGKPTQPRVIDLGHWRYVALLLPLSYLLLSLVLPIAILVFMSILKYPTFDFSLTLLTTYNWEYLFGYRIFPQAIRNSLFLAITGASIACLLSIFISYITNRTASRGSRLLGYISTIPVGIPHVTMGIAYLWAWLIVRGAMIYGTIWILLMAYISKYLPLGIHSVTSSLTAIHNELEESASICGSSTIQRIISIMIPLMKRGILAGWFFLFIEMVRDLSISLFLYRSGTQVISILLWDAWTEGLLGVASAASLLILAVTFICLVIARSIFGIKLEALYV